jgi:hypothetical protein
MRRVISSAAMSLPSAIDAGSDERIDPQNALLVSPMGGELQELSRIGNLFYAANQAAVTTTIALATTYTGLCVSNPINNGKNLCIRAASFKFSVAQAAVSQIWLIGGYSTGGIVTHTTPLVFGTDFGCMNLGFSAAPSALCDAAATLVNPRILMPLGGSFTAAALAADTPSIVNTFGAIWIQPGGWVALGTLTVSIGFAGIWWSEHPRA